MNICSFFIERSHKIPINAFGEQEWNGFEVLYASDTLSGSDTTVIQQNFLRHFNCSDEDQWHVIINNAHGKYIAFIHPGELWNSSMLEQTRNLLDSIKDDNTVPVGYGFVRFDTYVQFIGDMKLHVLGNNKIANNIPTPRFYRPSLKYFFDLTFIREYNITLPDSSYTWQTRYALFCLEYFTTLYSVYKCEPSFFHKLLGFSHNKDVLRPINMQAYNNELQSKKNRLVYSIWSEIYWKYQYIDFIYKIRSLYSKKVLPNDIAQNNRPH